jgi:hypothetical protein
MRIVEEVKHDENELFIPNVSFDIAGNQSKNEQMLNVVLSNLDDAT